jgi:hypothetical protein
VIARRGSTRAAAIVVLAALLPVLAGCGLESKDETSKEHAAIQAANYHIGGIRIRDAFITTPLAPTSAPASANAASYLVVTFVNDGLSSDTFTGITTTIGTTTLTGGPVRLPRGVAVQVSDPLINPAAPRLRITGIPPTVGSTVDVQFSFAGAGTTTPIAVPVVAGSPSLVPVQPLPTTTATVPTPIA